MNLYKPRTPGSAFAATERFVEECGGIDAVAEFAGKRPGTVYNWMDPEKGEGVPLAVAAQLTRHFGGSYALAELLAGCAGGLFLPVNLTPGSGPIAEVAARSAEEWGEMFATIVRATSPKGEGGQEITTREWRHIVSEIDDVIRLLCRIKAMAPPEAA
jgi:hypothetical protein